MSSKAGVDGFAHSAYEFTKHVTRALKVEKPFTRQRIPDPSPAEAEEYVKGN